MNKILATSIAAFILASSAQATIVSFYDLIGIAGAGLLAANEPTNPLGGTGGEIGAGIFLDDGNDADPNTNLLTLNVA